MSKEFTPILIGTVVFANGETFQVHQIKGTGACRITNLKTGDANYSHSIPNAWKSVRFQGRVLPNTDNTTGWNDNPYVCSDPSLRN